MKMETAFHRARHETGHKGTLGSCRRFRTALGTSIPYARIPLRIGLLVLGLPGFELLVLELLCLGLYRKLRLLRSLACLICLEVSPGVDGLGRRTGHLALKPAMMHLRFFADSTPRQAERITPPYCASPHQHRYGQVN